MIKKYFIETFAIDYKSLGIFRIGVGLLLIFDLASRLVYGYDLIAPNGVLPISQVFELLKGKSYLSLYFLSGKQWYFIFLISLSLTSYCFYLFGFRTKLFGAISFILLFSLQNRNPFVLHGGDIMLRLFLLISLLLPIESYSYDTKGRATDGRFTSVATFTLFIQIGLMYFFSALYKSGPEWFNGTAVASALKVDWISNSTGLYISNCLALLKPLNYGTLLLEFSILPLTLISFKRSVIRWILFVSIFVFHLGTFIAMDIGTFPFIGMLASLVFYPGTTKNLKSDLSWSFKNSTAFVILSMAITCNILFFFKPIDLEIFKSLMINSGIYQKWSMFSPSPASTNISFEVKLDHSISINDIKKNYSSHHWQKLLMQVARPENSKLLQAYAHHLCKTKPTNTIRIILHEFDKDTQQEFPDRRLDLIAVDCEALDAT